MLLFYSFFFSSGVWSECFNQLGDLSPLAAAVPAVLVHAHLPGCRDLHYKPGAYPWRHQTCIINEWEGQSISDRGPWNSARLFRFGIMLLSFFCFSYFNLFTSFVLHCCVFSLLVNRSSFLCFCLSFFASYLFGSFLFLSFVDCCSWHLIHYTLRNAYAIF